jgi:hypothetical protein
VQADNYFKVRRGAQSVEFPFITEYSNDAAKAELAARAAAACMPGSTVSVYDATHFPDYPQVGDWAPEDLREPGDESDSEATLH